MENKNYKNKTLGVFITAFFILMFSNLKLQSTTWVVNVSDFQFSPSTLNITVGDTVKWQWLNGDHTTTSLTVPAGAQTWDRPMNLTSQTFIYRTTVVGSYTYKCTPHFPSMQGNFTVNPVGIIREQGEVPAHFGLYQNFPNPFNPSTNVKFDIPERSDVQLKITDALGREVEVLVNEQLEGGKYTATWDASGYVSGIYFCRLKAVGIQSGKSFERTTKLTLVK